MLGLDEPTGKSSATENSSSPQGFHSRAARIAPSKQNHLVYKPSNPRFTEVVKVHNLSLTGLGLSGKNIAFPEPGQEIYGDLFIDGSPYTLKLKVSQKRAGGVGCSFVNADPGLFDLIRRHFDLELAAAELERSLVPQEDGRELVSFKGLRLDCSLEFSRDLNGVKEFELLFFGNFLVKKATTPLSLQTRMPDGSRFPEDFVSNQIREEAMRFVSALRGIETTELSRIVALIKRV